MTQCNTLPGLPIKESERLVNLASSVMLPNQKIELWLFGSRARGDHRPYSDIDILIVSQETLPFTSPQIHTLKDLLEDSDSPYKFDLVEERSLLDDYRQGVFRDKKLIAVI